MGGVMALFLDRAEAGEQLAETLAALGLADPVVLALPRGGVPVAAPVAKRLGAPLDLVMVRKLGVPGHAELAAGAVVDGPVHQAVFNQDILRQLGLGEADFAAQIARELAVIEERRARYLGGRKPVPVKGRDVVVVDDGIATGATARAALKGLAAAGAGSVTLAVPVAPREAQREFADLVDRFICLDVPEPFFAVGAHYQRFGQTGDDEVVALMRGSGDGGQGVDL